MLGPREAALGLMIIKLEREHKKVEERGIESLLLGWPKCSFGFPYHLTKKKKKQPNKLFNQPRFFFFFCLFFCCRFSFYYFIFLLFLKI